MPDLLNPRLLDGLAVYQDVVLDGQVVRQGTRDCQARWDVIAPWLTDAGTILDVGSNFGWFGLTACRAHPRAVVASVEADERSATVQRRVLESHRHERIVLVTRKAGKRLVGRFASCGQRFDAALVLSILHWLPDHRAFLEGLGRIAGRIVVEQPHPDEAGAGIDRVRREIGAIGPYLGGLFPGRPVVFLGHTASHRSEDLPRELWLVDRPADWPGPPTPGIDLEALLDLSVSWPPRTWWRRQLDLLAAAGAVDQRLLVTAAGLSPAASASPPSFDPEPAATATASSPPPSFNPEPMTTARRYLRRLRRKLNNVPEGHLLTTSDWLFRRLRRAAGWMARWWRP